MSDVSTSPFDAIVAHRYTHGGTLGAAVRALDLTSVFEGQPFPLAVLGGVACCKQNANFVKIERDPRGHVLLDMKKGGPIRLLYTLHWRCSVCGRKQSGGASEPDLTDAGIKLLQDVMAALDAHKSASKKVA